jgi:hypothetical protein
MIACCRQWTPTVSTMTTRLTMCAFCRHYHRTGRKGSCAAFPDAIPDAILFGRRDHLGPVPGDHGIRFELADDCPPVLLEWFAELAERQGIAPAWAHTVEMPVS